VFILLFDYFNSQLKNERQIRKRQSKKGNVHFRSNDYFNTLQFETGFNSLPSEDTKKPAVKAGFLTVSNRFF